MLDSLFNLNDTIRVQVPTSNIVLTAGAILLATGYCYRRLTRVSLKDLRGPESKSFLAGNIIDIFEDSSVTAKWQNVFGTVMRLHPQIFTGEAILVSDFSAMRHIFQSECSDQYIRAPEWYAMASLLAGDSIGSAEGDVHKRHRKGIRPAFGVPETRALLPVFNSITQRLCEKWDSILLTDSTTTLNVSGWFSKAALDAFGEVAFDYNFGGIDNTPTPLARAMPSVILETFGSPTAGQLACLSLFQYIPLSLVKWILNKSPLPIFEHVRNTNRMSRQYLLEIIQERKAMPDLSQGRDILSIILKAGMSEDPSERLTDEEIVSELRFLLLAGQETSANTIAWIFYEICLRPQYQAELRKEVRATREKLGAREFSAQDLHGMPFLNAVIKETLRLDPVIQTLFKEALQDDVLPLSQPITLKSGKVVDKLPIPKGTKLYTSVAAFNVNPNVWGDDADIFNPYRWLEDRTEKNSGLGMYANLMSFSAGTKGCIGWRFAILQLQNLLAELIDRYEFSFPQPSPKIIRANCMATCPMIEGEFEKGAQLPLIVRRAN